MNPIVLGASPLIKCQYAGATEVINVLEIKIVINGEVSVVIIIIGTACIVKPDL